MNSSTARRALKKLGVEPIIDPKLLKTFVYRREDVLSVASILASNQSLNASVLNVGCQTTVTAGSVDINDENSKIGEPDASVL